MDYCGIDVHQKYSEICILAEDGEVMERTKVIFGARLEDLRKLNNPQGCCSLGVFYSSLPPESPPLLAGSLCEPPPSDGAPLPPDGGVNVGVCPVGFCESGV